MMVEIVVQFHIYAIATVQFYFFRDKFTYFNLVFDIATVFYDA